jgi:hypothetical protein
MIFIISSPRSGSHALRSILGQETMIKNFNEVFNHDLQHAITGNFSEFFLQEIVKKIDWKYNSRSAEEIIKNYFSYINILAASKIPLLDIKYGHLRCMDWPGPNRDLTSKPLLIELIIDSNIPIIRLNRKNWLAQYVSEIIAIESNVWVLHDKENQKWNGKIYMDKNSLMNRLRKYEEDEILVSHWLNGYQNTINMNYEAMMIENGLTDKTRHSIEKFLGFRQNKSIKSATKKILPPHNDSIENYREVCEWLKNSKYKEFIE